MQDKVSKLKSKPFIFLLIYAAVIFIYAVLYWYFPNSIEAEEKSFLTSTYFSIVTITTLGYGEITPNSDLGKILSASEAILGIIIIGLFLSSLWNSFSVRIEKSQKESLDKNLKDQNQNKLSSFYRFLINVIKDFQLTIAELTTPMNNRSLSNLDTTFKFSNLKDLYKPSLKLGNGFEKPIIDYYYEKQDNIVVEFKFILAHYDLSSFPIIDNKIIDFMTLSYNKDVREAIFDIHVNTENKKALEKMIGENDCCPDLAKHLSNIITPIIILYKTLTEQISILEIILEEFEKLYNKKM